MSIDRPHNSGMTRFTRLLIKTGRWPAPLGLPGRWVGRQFGAPMNCGLRLVIHNPLEAIQREVVARGVYEPSIIRVFRAILRPGDVFFDVGGNIGHHSLVAASCQATVHTFEPLPRLAERIRENVEFNALSRQFTINNSAVGAEAGTATLNEVDRADDGSHSLISGVAATSSRVVNVSVITLDHYVGSGKAPVPQLIKIDVEGYEARVLDGAAEILAAPQPPMIVMETGDRLANAIGESAHSILGRLFRAGFRVWQIPDDASALQPVSEAAISPDLNNYLAVHPASARAADVYASLHLNAVPSP